MSYTALYRKYRPKKFEDVVGQDIIVTILKNSIINNKISHAYLFNGARGTGKTSVAKIFAKAVNCESTNNGDFCGKCDVCKKIAENDVDIIEIDAASNNGVEEIREIRNKVKLMPTVGKYKVYIIDEVHMLSIGAFNALLKTLEEPPKHVIFILATTEINKIPLTILSRCQRFDFGKISVKSLIKRLKFVCEQEQRVISDNIIATIAELSDGGCRDAVNLLDQVLSLNKDEITEKDIYDINGTIPESLIIELFKTIYYNDLSKGLTIIDGLVDEGKNLSSVVDKLLILARNISINASIGNYFTDEKKDLYGEFDIEIEILKKITEILIELNTQLTKSTNQKNLFEIYYVYLTNIVNNDVKAKEVINTKNKVVNSKIIDDESNQQVNIIKAVDNTNNNEITNYENIKKIRINNVLATANKIYLQKILKEFDRINDFVANKVYNNVATLLLDGSIVVASESYLLFSYNDERLLSSFYLNLAKIENLLETVFGNRFFAVAVSSDEWLIIRNKYVEDKKNNIEYKLIEEKIKVSDSNEKHSNLENMAINLFGSDIVESEEI